MQDLVPVLPDDIILEIPCRWDLRRRNHDEAVQEIDRLAGILKRGAEALSGLYLRICDAIRWHELTDEEIRETLGKHFPASRVSEFLLVARAPDDVYHRYRAGFFGFKAALDQSRAYRVGSPEKLRTKQIRRAAERIVSLLGAGEIEVRGHRVIVT